jgi:DNA-binding NarL/FixJ family response regulator
VTGDQGGGAAVTPPPVVRVLVADDQELVREGIASLLGIQPGITVVGTARDGAAAAELAVALAADVVLMDVRMPGGDGTQAAALIRRERPGCQVVMLTTFDDEEYVVQAIRAGAVGYLLKDLPAAELAAAVRLAHAGIAQFGAQAVGRLAAAIARQDQPAPLQPAPLQSAPLQSAPLQPGPLQSVPSEPVPAEPATGAPDGTVPVQQEQPGQLTARETEVLRLVACGATNREIASRLFLSEGTVKNHLSRILSRLGLRDRTQAAIYAHDHGLL